MPTPLTDADKVLRNDTGKDIVEKLDDIAQALGVGVNAEQVNYDNTDSGLEATDVQNAIDEVNANKVDKKDLILLTSIDTPDTIQTFNDGGDNIPLKKCEVEIEPDTTGFSSVNVFISNKNFSEITENSVAGDINFTFTDEGTISVSGEISTANRNANVGHFILAPGTYTFSGIPDSLVASSRKAALVLCKDAYSGSVNIIKTIYSNVAISDQFTLTEVTDCYLRIYIYAAAGTLSNVVFSPQIELNDEATSFVKHSGNKYTIQLGETLTQGGTLEIISGLLTRTDTTTSQLTGINASTISGINNIYADTGDINSIKYFNKNADQMAMLIGALTT